MSAPPVLPTAGHSSLENDVLLDSSVSIEAKAMLTTLDYFDRGNGCFARKETLSHIANLSLYRLKNALDELIDLGKITIQRRGQGKTDIIRIVPRSELEPVADVERQIDSPPLSFEEIDRIEDEMAQFEEVDPEIEEEPLQVDPDESMEKIADLEVKSFDFQKPNTSAVEHYKEEDLKKNSFNTPCTELSSTEETHQSTEKQCEVEKLISFFYHEKEGRKPTKNELINWTPTAHRLLDEFTLSELQEATRYAIDQGARLFYFVALVGPDFIIRKRKERNLESERLKRASKAFEQERQQACRLESLRASATAYDAEKQSLLTGLENNLRPQSFRTWFKDAFVVDSTEKSITLAVPSSTMAEWITQRYTALLQEISGKANIRVVAAG